MRAFDLPNHTVDLPTNRTSRARVATISLLLLSAIALPRTAQSAVETTFDADLEGWAVFGDNVFYWVDGEGNPDGCLRIDDDAIGEWSVATAPAAFLGDWTSLGVTDSLAYDAIHTMTNGSGNPPVMFRIEGPGGIATATRTGFPANVWNHFSIPIDPTAWTLESGTWSGLIGNVTAVELAAEMIFGDEVVRMDNIELGGTPVLVNPTDELDTFDDGDIGWSGHSASVSVVPEDGDTGPYLEVEEDRDGGRVVLPSWSGGSWTQWDGVGELSFSFFPPDPVFPSTNAVVELHGPGGTAMVETTLDPYVGATAEWIPIVLAIAETEWTMVRGTWSGLLEHVQEVVISADASTGNDRFGLDNVYRGVSGGAPEPHVPLQILDEEHSVCDFWSIRNASALALNPADGFLYALVNETIADGGGVYAVTGPNAVHRLYSYDRPLGLVFTEDGAGFVTENYAGVLHRFVGMDGTAVWGDTFHTGDDDVAGLLIAPAGFDGPVVSGGDILITDHGNGGADGVWAASPDTAHLERELVPDPGSVDWYDLATDGSSVWVCDAIDDDVLSVIHPDGSTTPFPLSQNIPEMRVLAYDSGQHALYTMSSSSPVRLYRIDAATGDVTAIAEGIGSVGYGNLEIDSAARKLYLADDSMSRVYEICLPAGSSSVDEDVSHSPLTVTIAPNPLVSRSQIRLRLPHDASLEVDVLDALGRRVDRLASGWHEAGSVVLEWDGRDDQGTPVPSGAYFVRYVVDGKVSSSRAIVLR